MRFAAISGLAAVRSAPIHRMSIRFALVALLGLAATLIGCQTQFTVLPVPITVLTANAGGPYTATAGDPVTFNGGKSIGPKGESLTYSWNFGDGSTGNGISPTYTYANAGVYTVVLTVTDTSMDTASSTGTATINPVPPPKPPFANAGGPYSGTVGTAVFFDGSKSYDPQNEPLTYAWAFGDGATWTGVKPGHVYWAVGTYTATLTVTNTSNLSSSATAQVTITAAPPLPPPIAATMLYQLATSDNPPGTPIAYATVFIYPCNSNAATLNPTITLFAATTADLYSTEAADIYGTIYIGNINTPVPGQAGTSQILIVPEPKAGGNVVPSRIISGPDTGINSIGGLTVDNYGNIYMITISDTGAYPTQIVELAANSKGDAAPLRTIAISLGDAIDINYMKISVDAIGNIVLNVAGDGTNAIQVFSPIQSGNVAPARSISDPSIANAHGSAIDPAGNIYVIAESSVIEYPGGLTGSNTPITTITLVAPGPNPVKNATGIAIDTEGIVYVGAHVGVSTLNNDSIFRYPANPTPASVPVIEQAIPGGTWITVNN